MNYEEKVEEFKIKYPLLFKAGCLRSGFYCPDGWLPLVTKLCSVIENEMKYNVPEEIRGEIYIVQCKSKFASLRFYMNASTPFIDGAIALAETLSGTLCEECGASAKLKTGGWARTLCEKDAALEDELRKERDKKFVEEQNIRAAKRQLDLEAKIIELEKVNE